MVQDNLGEKFRRETGERLACIEGGMINVHDKLDMLITPLMKKVDDTEKLALKHARDLYWIWVVICGTFGTIASISLAIFRKY